MMWERIRAAWQEWSILIVGLAVIFSAIVLGGRLSSSTNPAPAISSAQGRDRGKPIAASTVTTSPPPQGGSAKPPAKQVAQSSQAPSPQPAHQDNPATAPKPSANAAEPSPAAAPSPPPHDHMAASSTPSPSATTGTIARATVPNSAPPAANAAAPASNAIPAMGDASSGRQVFKKCQACHSLEPGKNMLGPSLGRRHRPQSGCGGRLQLIRRR